MSHISWSSLPEEEADRSITFMDRQVADGWFDICRPDLDYKFKDFMHNVPRAESNDRLMASAKTNYSSWSESKPDDGTDED